MKKLLCEACGANDLLTKNGYLICNYCGSKYQIETDNKKNSEISLDDDIARLLSKCKTDPKNARKYANLILDIDPSNSEAKKYI